MKVAVSPPARGSLLQIADFVLQQDGWDDFGFKTQCHLFHFAADESEGGFVDNVKILCRGQAETATSLLPTVPLGGIARRLKMWNVKLPDTGDVDAQLDAALIHKDETKVHDLTDAERAAVHAIHTDYDQRLGEPDAALKPAALAGCADALHDAYSQVQKGARLDWLR